MNLTDPDCGILHRKGAGTVIGYNAQIGVDIQGAGLIVTNSVSAKGGDAELLRPILEQLAPELGAVKEVVVDCGYESGAKAYELEKSLGTKVYYPPRPIQLSDREPKGRHSPRQRLVRHMRYLIKKRIESPHGQWLQRRRQTVAEGAFAFIKRALGFQRFSLRGLQKVQTEWQLVCLAFNLRKLA
jgi:hypothetical protein